MDIKELAEKHWDEYVGPLLKVHGEDEETIKKCKFHYVTSAVHFTKHAMEGKVMKIVIVDWNDVTKESSNESFNEMESIDNMLSPIKSIGWLYKETDKTILIVQEFNNEGKPRDWVVIPKALITKMEEQK